MPSTQLKRVKDGIAHALSWWKGSRLGRAMRQYNLANGNLLSGGITYKAIFSLFAALTIGFTVFVRFLGNDEELRESVVEAINNAIPNLVETPSTPGMLPIDQLVLSTGFSVTSTIAALVLLWSVITCMEALRSSVRVMFSLPPATANALSGKIRGLAAFAGVALGVLLSSLVGIGASALSTFIDQWVDLGRVGTWSLRAGSHLITFLFDMAVFTLIVRLLASVKAERRDLLLGAVVAAGGFAVIRFLGTSVVAGSATNNPLFATGAVLVTILVWLYMCARILLTAAALTANTPLALLERLESEQFAIERVEAHSADYVPLVRYESPDSLSTVGGADSRGNRGMRAIGWSIAGLIGVIIGRSLRR